MYQNHTKDTNNNCQKSLLCGQKVSFQFYGFHLLLCLEQLRADTLPLERSLFLASCFFKLFAVGFLFPLYFICKVMSPLCVCVLQEKLIQAIKRIKHEVDECREAERETYIESVEVEVPSPPYSLSFISFYTQLFQFIAD